MDHFSKLPPLILLSVVKCIPDVYTLRNLRRASPIVSRILQEVGIAAEVIEAILSSGYTLASNQFFFRTVVLIIWGPHPTNIRLDSLECLQAILYGAAPTSSNFGLDKELPGSLPLTTWKELPATAVLRAVALSEQVQKLMHHCFHTLLARVLASHPRRPIDPMYNARLFYNVYQQAKKSRLPLPPIVPIPPSELISPASGAASPPSWGEQQLLELGAWSFALYSLLKNPVGVGILGLWPLTIEDLSFNNFWTQKYYLPGLIAVKKSISINATHISAEIREGKVCKDDFKCCAGFNLIEGDDVIEDPEYPQNILRRPITRSSDDYCTKYTIFTPWSPIDQAEPDCWDWLGFSIWSSKRMASLGFMVHADDEMQKKRIPDGNWPFKMAELHDSFAWRSVMTDDQVRKMEEGRLEKWARIIGEDRIRVYMQAETAINTIH